jgi:hypothetical protein
VGCILIKHADKPPEWTVINRNDGDKNSPWLKSHPYFVECGFDGWNVFEHIPRDDRIQRRFERYYLGRPSLDFRFGNSLDRLRDGVLVNVPPGALVFHRGTLKKQP